jgi:hypothetical protein
MEGARKSRVVVGELTVKWGSEGARNSKVGKGEK